MYICDIPIHIYRYMRREDHELKISEAKLVTTLQI